MVANIMEATFPYWRSPWAAPVGVLEVSDMCAPDGAHLKSMFRRLDNHFDALPGSDCRQEMGRLYNMGFYERCDGRKHARIQTGS